MEQKNISLSYGIHRTPSIGHEGELSACVNLIPRNGELVNILPPARKATPVLMSGETLVAIHHVSPDDKDIYILQAGSTLYWCYDNRSNPNVNTRMQLRGAGTGYSITPIGNVLCYTAPNLVEYFLWNGSGYTNLGNGGVDVDIQFGIESVRKTKRLENGGVTMVRSSSGSQDGLSGELFRSDAPKGQQVAKWTPVDAFVVGDEYAVESMREGGPVSYAQLRVEFVGMFSPIGGDSRQRVKRFQAPPGEIHLRVTVPEPPADTPLGSWTEMQVYWNYTVEDYIYDYVYVSVRKVDATQQDTSSSMTVSFKLQQGADKVIGMANELIESCTKDNLFTQPFFVRYAIRLKTGQLVNISAPCFIEPNTLYSPEMELREYSVKDTVYNMSVSASTYAATLYYRVASIPDLQSWGDVVESVVVAITPPVWLYDQSVSDETLGTAWRVYKKGATYEMGSGDSWGENWNASRTISGVLNGGFSSDSYPLLLPTGGTRSYTSGIYVDSAIKERAKSALSTWYIIKEIPIKALDAKAEWIRVDLDTGVLSALYAQETGDITLLTDTAVSYYKFNGTNGAFAYNNRLFFFGGVEQSFGGWNPLRMSGWVGTWSDDPTTTDTTVYFSDGKGITEAGWPTNGRTASASALRFLAYPDPAALRIYVYGYGSYAYSLSPQGTQNLAVHFFWEGTEGRGSYSGERKSAISYPNKLYMSYQNQPLALDRDASITFSGTIRAMSVVTQALSQGQFGQFPLYVFTSDGIWMLEVSSTGAIKSSHPVSRDVITQGTQPLQTDDAVFFITAQGLKRIVGSKVDLVSEVMHGAAVNASRFALPEVYPAADDFYHQIVSTLYNGVRETQLSPIVTDFLTALQTARMLYDYTQRLIHIYIGTQGHFVYDLDGGEWAEQRFVEAIWGASPGLIDIFTAIPNPVSIVHQYPYSVMQINRTDSGSTDAGLYVYDGSTRGEGNTEFGSDFPRFASALTRPIALTNPTEMKALMDFRLIGQKADAVTQSRSAPFHRVLVYASKDGIRWHRLNSLKKGSYKYFRFLIYSLMADADTLTGLTVHYQVRRTNKLR